MDRIMPYPVFWLGHAGDGRDYSRLHDAGIKAVVQLAAEEPPLLVPRGLTYLRFPVVDGAENNRVTDSRSPCRSFAGCARVPTLICCGAGMSRSPAIAAVAISWISGDAPEETLKLITRQRIADISPGLWNGVRGVLSSRDMQSSF